MKGNFQLIIIISIFSLGRFVLTMLRGGFSLPYKLNSEVFNPLY